MSERRDFSIVPPEDVVLASASKMPAITSPRNNRAPLEPAVMTVWGPPPPHRLLCLRSSCRHTPFLYLGGDSRNVHVAPAQSSYWVRSVYKAPRVDRLACFARQRYLAERARTSSPVVWVSGKNKQAKLCTGFPRFCRRVRRLRSCVLMREWALRKGHFL